MHLTVYITSEDIWSRKKSDMSHYRACAIVVTSKSVKALKRNFKDRMRKEWMNYMQQKIVKQKKAVLVVGIKNQDYERADVEYRRLVW